MISAIADVVSAATVVTAAVLALNQLKQSMSHQHQDGTNLVMQKIEGIEFQELRLFFVNNRAQLQEILELPDALEELDKRIQEGSISSFGVESVADIKSRLADLEYTAWMSLHDRIFPAFERAFYAPIIKDLWPLIEGFILSVRADDVRSLPESTREFLRSNPVYMQHLDRVNRMVITGIIFEDAKMVRRVKRFEHLKSEENSKDYVLGER
ncbi:hypothetical protein [Streptomyces sp. NPDC052127]|uniref:hypothetical protein n=1 Tax=Streptomyces sp. NPDC052127 TaxID=3155679 RepID=UPI003423D35B